MSQLTDVRDTLRTAASSDVLVFPTDAGWDDARRAWNLAVDQRPAVVALPESVDDVVDAVDYARTLGLRIAVQGTGHGAPRTPLDGTMLVNTSRMTGVEVDPRGRTARVAAGTIWADVVDAAVPHGLTALHGSAHDVGVVGYSLGGGIGWLARKHGLSSSSVLSAEVVTADGEVVRADRETNADLFWALRGGGGSFGDRHRGRDRPLPGHRGVRRLARLADGARGRGARRVGRVDEGRTRGGHVGRPDAPDPADPGDARAAPRPAGRGRRGRVPRHEEEGRELLRPLRDLEPELDTFATVPAAALTQLHQDPPGPVPEAARAGCSTRSTRPRPTAIVRAAAMDGTAPLISVEVRHLEGALGRPDPNGGVLSHFEAPYAMYSVGDGAGPRGRPGDPGAHRRDPLRGRSRGSHAARTSISPRAPSKAAPSTRAGVYERLTEIRAELDPDGVFRAKHAID